MAYCALDDTASALCSLSSSSCADHPPVLVLLRRMVVRRNCAAAHSMAALSLNVLFTSISGHSPPDSALTHNREHPVQEGAKTAAQSHSSALQPHWLAITTTVDHFRVAWVLRAQA